LNGKIAPAELWPLATHRHYLKEFQWQISSIEQLLLNDKLPVMLQSKLFIKITDNEPFRMQHKQENKKLLLTTTIIKHYFKHNSCNTFP